MAVHAAADDLAVQHIEGGEQGCGAIPLVVMRHGAAAPLLRRQSRLGPIKRLDLALFIDRQHDGMRWWIDVEADDVAQLADEQRIVGQLELSRAVGLQAVPAPDALHRLTLMPLALVIAATVQWVRATGGSVSVRATTPSARPQSWTGRCGA